MNKTLIALLLGTGAIYAHAGTIYKCAGEDGSTLISNTKVDKTCKAVVSGPDNALPAPKARAAATPSPAGFPKVAEDTQKARDGDRKRILEQEMTGELKNLEQAKKELLEQEPSRAGEDKQKTLDRTQLYRDRVAQHERNISAINRELGNLR